MDNKHHTANFPLVCTSHNFSSRRFRALNPRHYFANLFLAVWKGEGGGVCSASTYILSVMVLKMPAFLSLPKTQVRLLVHTVYEIFTLRLKS